MPLPQLRVAGWAPIVTDDVRWICHRDAAAMRWLVENSNGDPLVLCVGAHARHFLKQPGLDDRFVRCACTVTDEPPAGLGSTFAPDVSAQMLARAMRTADHHALAVTETAFPVEGWAMEVHAVDIRTGETTVDTRTDEQRQLLARLVRVLRNGWVGQLAGRMVRTYLEQLEASGMTWAVWAGSMIALSPENADLDRAEPYLPPSWRDEIAGHLLWGG